MVIKSISKKLLTRVLSFYFILTLIVTGIQIIAEYTNTKSHINEELLTLEKTFSGSLTRAVWELNTQQIIDIAEGLISTPNIKGISIKDDNKEIIVQLGQLPDEHMQEQSTKNKTLESLSQGFFSHTFPLIFEFSGRESLVGNVTISSNNEVIFNRIEVGLYFLIANAMVKTAVLMLLFSWAFSNFLTKPLTELTEQMQGFNINDPEASKLHTINYEKNELTILENAYNHLIDELLFYQNRLVNAQKTIVVANAKLDEHNIQLEQEVAKKASSLSNSMLKMELQKQEVLLQQKQLKEENSRRKKTEIILLETNKNLKNSILELNSIHKHLIKSEKMMGIGYLLSELTSKVEAPMSVNITSVSYLSDLINQLKDKINKNELSKKALQEFIEQSQQSVKLLTTNLNKSVFIINEHNQIAIDQIDNKLKSINIYNYVNDVVNVLQTKLDEMKHTIKLNCPVDIQINTYAGSLSQLIITLIINSINYNFENIAHGHINITILLKKNTISIHYHDNGVGLSQTELNDMFTLENFKQNLNYHVIHNIVTNNLNGSISAYSELNEGLGFIIKFDNIT